MRHEGKNGKGIGSSEFRIFMKHRNEEKESEV
jgi:hypothetical protein